MDKKYIYILMISSLSIYCRGCMWKSADDKIRNCFPTVITFQVDYLEACKLTLVCQGMACSTCMATKCDFGNLGIKHEPCMATRMSEVFKYAEGIGSTS